MKTTKLFAVDLDGTLLDRGGHVHAADREAIVTMRAKGVHVTIVTGRLYSGSRFAAREIGAADAIACADGSHIVHAGTNVDLFHDGIAGDAADLLREAAAVHAPVCFVFANDQIVHDAAGEPYLPYVRTWSSDVVAHDRAIDHACWQGERGITELVCIGDKTVVEGTEHEIRERLRDSLQIAKFPFGRGEVWGMVVRAAGSTKGTAVQFLARHYGAKTEEVVAVGDWWNDLPMFAAAGRSFAMGQAPDAVKAAATDVLEATSTTGGGIAEAARRAGILP